VNVCRHTLVPHLPRPQGAAPIHLARPQTAGAALLLRHGAAALRRQPHERGSVDAGEDVLPRLLLLLLRTAPALLLRHGETVGAVEDRLVGGCADGHRHDARPRAQRVAAHAAVDEARDANYSNPDDHPNETKEAAAIASGFSSYTACYRAKQKLKLQI